VSAGCARGAHGAFLFPGGANCCTHFARKNGKDSVQATPLATLLPGNPANLAGVRERNQFGERFRENVPELFPEDEAARQIWLAARNSAPAALSTEARDALRADARDIWQARTGRPAIWDDLQVHHRIPLEWAHLFPHSDPNRISNLIGMTSANHTQVTNAWNAWRQSLNGRIPTQAEVLQQAIRIDEQFGNLMRFLP
jgi:hypothetical protein